MSDIFHKGKYYISFKRNLDETKKDITITIIKVYENDCLKILLSDDDDPSLLCVLSVTRKDYEDLKKQQGLLIDFDNFPAQLVRLLQQCSANNMFLILQQSNPVQYFFEIVEHNEFRRLFHLSLKTTPATDNDIKKHMSDTIINLKKSFAVLKTTASNSEMVWNEKCMSLERKVHDLTLTMSKMEEDKLRRETEYQEALRREKDRMTQERLEWQTNNEILMKSQNSAIKEAIERKDKQLEEMKSQCNHLNNNITALELELCEKSQRILTLERELQSAQMDAATYKAKSATFEKTVMEKDNIIQQMQVKCCDYEKVLKDNSDIINEMDNKILSLKKEKMSLEERVSLSESLSNKNNEAALTTSEQLIKANQIIAKQNADLMEIKEKLLCRTAIALEQEKVIDRNEIELKEINKELYSTKTDLCKLKAELDGLREKLDVNEKYLQEKEETIKNNNLVIQWLHKKMDGLDTERALPMSTPRNPHNRLDGTEPSAELLPDFYASRSDIEETPRTEVISKNGRTGLDPKYLQPHANNKHNKEVTSHRSKASDKENANTNLPKVFYKEKKSTRSSHRSTPVSAYFP